MLRCQYHFRRKFTITSGDHVSSKTGRDVSRGQWSLLSLRAGGTFRPERCRRLAPLEQPSPKQQGIRHASSQNKNREDRNDQRRPGDFRAVLNREPADPWIGRQIAHCDAVAWVHAVIGTA